MGRMKFEFQPHGSREGGGGLDASLSVFFPHFCPVLSDDSVPVWRYKCRGLSCHWSIQDKARVRVREDFPQNGD